MARRQLDDDREQRARHQRAAGSGPSTPRPPRPARGRATIVVPGSVDQLTSRELEVLGLLAAGSSNQAITRELVVSLDTVKKHVGHVLGKLGAASRTEAVARARQLGLVPWRGRGLAVPEAAFLPLRLPWRIDAQPGTGGELP